MTNVAQIDMVQVRWAVERMPGHWETEDDQVVCYDRNNKQKRRALTRIALESYEDKPVLVVDGRDAGKVRDKLRAAGYDASCGTVE